MFLISISILLLLCLPESGEREFKKQTAEDRHWKGWQHCWCCQGQTKGGKQERRWESLPLIMHHMENESWNACFPWQWFICIFILDAFLYVEQLMKAEEKGSGAVAWSVYGAYVKAAGGPIVFLINAFLFLSTTGSIAFSNWWLSYWITQGSGVSLETTLLYCNRQHLYRTYIPKEI